MVSQPPKIDSYTTNCADDPPNTVTRVINRPLPQSVTPKSSSACKSPPRVTILTNPERIRTRSLPPPKETHPSPICLAPPPPRITILTNPARTRSLPSVQNTPLPSAREAPSPPRITILTNPARKRPSSSTEENSQNAPDVSAVTPAPKRVPTPISILKALAPSKLTRPSRARATASCWTSPMSTRAASCTRKTLHGFTLRDSPQSSTRGGSAKWCAARAARNAPANADNLKPPPPPPPLPLPLPLLPSFPLPLTALPSPPKLLVTQTRRNVPPPKPLHERLERKAVHIKRFRASRSQLRPPFLPPPLTLCLHGRRVAATTWWQGASPIARRAGSPSRGGDLHAGQRAPSPARPSSPSPPSFLFFSFRFTQQIFS